MHNTNKRWICDCCGSRFGFKNGLKRHMMIHLPPSFSCSVCDKKFVYASNLNIHKKLHEGILKEICRLCNKKYASKQTLSNHITLNHFPEFHCEVAGCLSVIGCKSKYNKHLKTVHKKEDQVLIENLVINLKKLKPNFEQFKYV